MWGQIFGDVVCYSEKVCNREVVTNILRFVKLLDSQVAFKTGLIYLLLRLYRYNTGVPR